MYPNISFEVHGIEGEQAKNACVCVCACWLCKYFKGEYVGFVSQITPFTTREPTHN